MNCVRLFRMLWPPIFTGSALQAVWISKMKLIAIIALSFTLDLVCSKCSPSEYLTEEGFCCRKPPPSSYITKNCTSQGGVSAQPCSTCTDKGMKIVASCTRFSDTKCGLSDTFTEKSANSSSTCPNCTSKVPLVNILIPLAVLLFTMLIALPVVFCYCLHKCKKTGEFVKVPV